MHTKNAKSLVFTIGAALAAASCGRTMMTGVDAKDTGKPPGDLLSAGDLLAESSPLPKEDAADAGTAGADGAQDIPALISDGPRPPDADAATLDRDGSGAGSGADAPPAIRGDGSVDGSTARRDTTSIDHGVAVDGGRPSVCTGTFAVGDFPPKTSIGGYATTIAAGDLDGDGNLDLITNVNSDSVSVLLGKGDGTFTTKVDYATGSHPVQVMTADVNGDGKVDVITANQGDNTVSVLLGKGDGALSPRQDWACGKYPYAVAIADLDGNGKPDLVTANYGANTVSVLLGKGDGTFAGNVDYAAGDQPRLLLAGDLNGDHSLDLVVVNGHNGTVSALFGKGDGTFAAGLGNILGANTDISAARLGDVSGDGKLDLIIALQEYRPSSILVLIGKGDGTFASPVTYSGENYQEWMVLSDVNGDGKLDIVVAGSDAVGVLFGQGDGTFAAKVESLVAGDATAISPGDFNGDGKLDLAVAAAGYESSDMVGVLVGSGAGIFGISSSSPTNGNSTSVALGDLDHDGRLDAVTNGGTGMVSVLMGKGDGSLAAKTDYPAGNRPISLVLGDVDGNGQLDIAAADGSAVDVLLGKGDGTFGTAATYATKDSATALALADVNGDGMPDIVTANSRGYGYKGTVSVLLGTGGGKLAAHVDYGVGYNPQGVTVGDVNGDGKLDIVVANTGQDGGWSTGVLLGKGDGTFTAEVEYGAGCGPDAVALGDLNRDGKLDIVIVNSLCSSATAGVLLGQGDGTFPNMVEYETNSDNVTAVVLTDVNGDGVLDIVTANSFPSGVSVLLGKGDGTFLSGVSYAVNESAMALGDLNGDGTLDLVTVSGSALNVLLGSCQ